jgi:hypothetical protein
MNSYFESKKEDFHAVKEAKQKESSRRRDSMVGRTEAARKVKDTEKVLEEEKKNQEKSLLDFRYTAWCGEKEFKKKEVLEANMHLIFDLEVISPQS